MAVEITDPSRVNHAVDATHEATKIIIDKYNDERGLKSEARKDALFYVKSEHDYIMETNNPEDREYSDKLSEIIKKAERGRWEPVREFLRSFGNEITNTEAGDDDWMEMGTALINLSRSI